MSTIDSPEKIFSFSDAAAVVDQIRHERREEAEKSEGLERERLWAQVEALEDVTEVFRHSHAILSHVDKADAREFAEQDSIE